MAFIDTYFKEVEQRFAVMKQEREPLEQAARLLFEAEKEHHTIYYCRDTDRPMNRCVLQF